MSILISPDALAARRPIVAGALAPLAASLAADLAPLVERDLYFPTEKALLTRDGGRCARDGTLLDFDPFQPHEHRCPRCGEVYRGEHHDRFWIYWYQLWLAERAVHAAVLGTVTGDERFLPLASRILDGYAERYLGYPNVDNVLGPTRLFFSTYLESIWLLQICIAADLVAARDPALAERVRERIVDPARAIIAEFDEGQSNRQVWNNAALMASSLFLNRPDDARRLIGGSSGVAAHLATGLLPDGSWYEGENYHLFAHRGLWYCVAMAERWGLEIPHGLTGRFDAGFRAPFATALPDFTLPSRRDSQYAISLRQWRIAEHCELGFARHEDGVLAGALGRMYQSRLPRNATGRDRSAADVERNAQPSALTRADLSWRALLFARPELPELTTSPPRSAVLESQGIAVFRRDRGDAYVALDYGHSGGGHGHPDRLNVLLAVGDVRWLDDFGTGSYTDRSLHWYRSTVAHNAPLFDGHSQRRVHGELLAYHERDGFGWIAATVAGLAPGVRASRTLVVTPSYVLDLLRWDGDRAVTIDLPLHSDLALDESSGATPARPATISGGQGTEDGFEFLRETSVQRADPFATLRAGATKGDARLDVFSTATAATEWWRATAPGAPGSGDHAFRIVRARDAAGALRFVWSWRGDVESVEWGDDTVVVRLRDGSIHEHRSAGGGWIVDVTTASGPTRVELEGAIDVAVGTRPKYVEPERPALEVPRRGLVVALGEANYRRSEQRWREAGSLTATVGIARTGVSTEIVVDVPRSDRTFVAAGAENPYDNESADVNGDGVELFVRSGDATGGWMLVPDLGSAAVRVRPIESWPASFEPSARWEKTAHGYRMWISLPTSSLDALDVVVNEMPLGRVRRRGQLVLSGGAGEFVYLRGDRHDADRLIPLRFTDA